MLDDQPAWLALDAVPPDQLHIEAQQRFLPACGLHAHTIAFRHPTPPLDAQARFHCGIYNGGGWPEVTPGLWSVR